MFTRHETMDLHEIASFKTVSLTKAKTMQVLVSCPDLKSILQQEVQSSTRHLQELQSILTKV